MEIAPIDSGKGQLKGILLCGRNAELVTRPARGQEIESHLCGCKIKGFVDVDETQHRRLYLRSPSLTPYLQPNQWSKAVILSEIFKFAATVTRTPGISSWFHCTVLIQIRILVQKRVER